MERMCAEVIWTHRGADGSIVRGYTAPCPNRARYLASIPSIGVPPTPICARHADTDRWANYVGAQYERIGRVKGHLGS